MGINFAPMLTVALCVCALGQALADTRGDLRDRLERAALAAGADPARPVVDPRVVDPLMADWQDGPSGAFEFTARIGRRYAVAAVCARACGGIDVELHDLDGRLILAHRGRENRAVLRTPVHMVGDVMVRIRVDGCSIDRDGDPDRCVTGAAVYALDA